MSTKTNMASRSELDDRVETLEVGLNAKIALKADADTSYTKTEVDAKTNILTEEIFDLDTAFIVHKAKTSDATSTTPVHCTPAEKAVWNAKSDASTTYTKDEVDAKLDAKAASVDLTSGLALKANAATTYTKDEVDSAISSAVANLCSEDTADSKISSALGGVFNGAVNLKNDDDLYAAVKSILEKLGATVKE